jgi:hypothetical protein
MKPWFRRALRQWDETRQIDGGEMRPVGPTAEGQTFAITLSLSSPEVLVDYTLHVRLLVIRAFPAPRHGVLVSQYMGIRDTLAFTGHFDVLFLWMSTRFLGLVADLFP